MLDRAQLLAMPQAQRNVANRLRRRMVDHPDMDRRTPSRPGQGRRGCNLPVGACDIPAKIRRVQPGRSAVQPGAPPRLPSGTTGQRRGPVRRSRLSRTHHRSGHPVRGAQHQMGALHRLRRTLRMPLRSNSSRLAGWFRSFYGAHLLTLLTLLTSFALVGYVVQVIGLTALWDPAVRWQGIRCGSSGRSSCMTGSSSSFRSTRSPTARSHECCGEGGPAPRRCPLLTTCGYRSWPAGCRSCSSFPESPGKAPAATWPPPAKPKNPS